MGVLGVGTKVDRKSFIEGLQSSEAYEYPLEPGMYLGFFVPGDTVVMSRIENLVAGTHPQKVVSCSVARLFVQRTGN